MKYLSGGMTIFSSISFTRNGSALILGRRGQGGWSVTESRMILTASKCDAAGSRGLALEKGSPWTPPFARPSQTRKHLAAAPVLALLGNLRRLGPQWANGERRQSAGHKVAIQCGYMPTLSSPLGPPPAEAEKQGGVLYDDVRLQITLSSWTMWLPLVRRATECLVY